MSVYVAMQKLMQLLQRQLLDLVLLLVLMGQQLGQSLVRRLLLQRRQEPPHVREHVATVGLKPSQVFHLSLAFSPLSLDLAESIDKLNVTAYSSTLEKAVFKIGTGFLDLGFAKLLGLGC